MNQYSRVTSQRCGVFGVRHRFTCESAERVASVDKDAINPYVITLPPERPLPPPNHHECVCVKYTDTRGETKRIKSDRCRVHWVGW